MEKTLMVTIPLEEYKELILVDDRMKNSYNLIVPLTIDFLLSKKSNIEYYIRNRTKKELITRSEWSCLLSNEEFDFLFSIGISEKKTQSYLLKFIENFKSKEEFEELITKEKGE